VSAALLLATYNGQIPFAIYAGKKRKAKSLSTNHASKSCNCQRQKNVGKIQEDRQAGWLAKKKKKRNLHMKMAHKKGQQNGMAERQKRGQGMTTIKMNANCKLFAKCYPHPLPFFCHPTKQQKPTLQLGLVVCILAINYRPVGLPAGIYSHEY